MSGPFADISAVSGIGFPDDGRAASIVDWDHDGDLDVWVANRSGPQVRFLDNRSPDDNNYLAVRLEGRQCNRDAIGARLTLQLVDEPSVQIRTVRAGDGFLAQSSKWIHFGLGKARRIDRLLVQWPGGDVETIEGLAANQRYRVVQGSGKAIAIAPARQRVTLPVAKLASAATSDAVQALLSQPVPLPPLPYRAAASDPSNRSAAGEADLLATSGATSPWTLLNLWASWCRPCAAELSEFSRRQVELSDAGVRVVALSVDDLQAQTDDAMPKPGTRRLITLPDGLESGSAVDATLDRLQLVHNLLFDRHRPLPLPSSFLINGQGELTAIYTGRVHVDRLLSDIQEREAADFDGRTSTLPLQGRWIAPARPLNILPIAAHLLEAGQVADAYEYVRSNRSRIRPGEAAFQLISRLGKALAAAGNSADALSCFRAALEARPDSVAAHINVGVALETAGRRADAVKYYEDALQLDSGNAQAHAKLGQALTGVDQARKAIGHLERALELDRSQVYAANHLAWLLATHSDSKIRDGARAVAAAQIAVSENTNLQQRSALLDTLAAAYAAAGSYDKAVATAEEARELARASGNRNLAAKIESRLQLYRQDTPYVDAVR